MDTSPGWYTYVWGGLEGSQTDLDNLQIKFESEQPTPAETIYDYDYVYFGDIFDIFAVLTAFSGLQC